MKLNQFVIASIFPLFSCIIWAQDLTGNWQQIDDKTGEAKAIIQIKKEADQTYTGKIIKITPRSGYTPKSICQNCPKPFFNQSILGMEILRGLSAKNPQYNYDFDHGRIIDPLSGKVYRVATKLNDTGNRLTLKAYLNSVHLGRSQTWIRQK